MSPYKKKLRGVNIMTKEKLSMSIKEADRLGVMRQVDKKILTLRQAGEQIQTS
jgi:hypothetical protein